MSMINISLHSKRFLTALLVIILFGIFALIFFQDTEDTERILRTQRENFIDVIDQRMTSLIVEINNFPGGAGDDISFLSSLSSVHHVVSPKRGEVSKEDLLEMKSDFSEFLIKNKVYGEVRYSDISGDVLLRASSEEGSDEISFKKDEESISHKEYFQRAVQLKKDEVYISEIFLRGKNGVPQSTGAYNFSYDPVLVYSTPVIDKKGEIKGVMSSIVYANYFLEDVRNFQRKGEHVFLISSRGEYLSHPDPSKEFGFIRKTEENFFKDYLLVPREVVEDSNKRRFETEESIFTLRRIYPTSWNFAFYEESENATDDRLQEYFWILISVSDKGHITRTEKIVLRAHVFFVLVTGVLLLTVIFLILILSCSLPNIGYSEALRALVVIKDKNEKK